MYIITYILIIYYDTDDYLFYLDRFGSCNRKYHNCTWDTTSATKCDKKKAERFFLDLRRAPDVGGVDETDDVCTRFSFILSIAVDWWRG